MEIHDILWETSHRFIKESIKNICHMYETDHKYNVKKFYDRSNKLEGFAVYCDEKDFRYIAEIHYIGTDKYVALRMYKWLIKGAKKIRLTCQKSNKRIIGFYTNLGYKIIDQDFNNLLLEKET